MDYGMDYTQDTPEVVKPKVFVLVSVDAEYGRHSLIEVFSTREKAQKYIDNIKALPYRNRPYYYEELEIDEQELDPELVSYNPPPFGGFPV